MDMEFDAFIEKKAKKVFSVEWITSHHDFFVMEHWCDITIKNEWPERKKLAQIIDNMEEDDMHSLWNNDTLIFFHCLKHLNNL